MVAWRKPGWSLVPLFLLLFIPAMQNTALAQEEELYMEEGLYLEEELSMEDGLYLEGELSMDVEDMLNMSIEELLQMPVEVSGSLTGTTRRLNPSTMTTLTREDIRYSGARDLDELLDIYIPNFQRMNEYYEFRKNGLRGINSDRDDKYLILVNGRIMNEHTHYGAISERDLPMLTDIHHVDVIRGPGSALYGPGAIAMVINIITETADTFEGTEITTRNGFVESFYSGEIKHGTKLSDDSGFFLFAGVSGYRGAPESKSAYEPGMPDPLITPVKRVVNYNKSFHGNFKYKLHGQYTKGNFDCWVRYTKGGIHRTKAYWWLDGWPQQGDGYQQATVFAGYTWDVSDEVDVDFSGSFDMMDYEKVVYDDVYAHREDEWTGKSILKWTPNEDHSLAVGGEISREKFGKDSPGWPHGGAVDWSFAVYGLPTPSWTTTLYSGLLEYQWNMSDKWTTFVGGRYDYHPYTKDMYSPRATIVFTPTEKDTAKLIYARSVRTGQAADMKLSRVLVREYTTPEKIDAFELRYERQTTKHLWLAFSGFYNYHDITSYNFSIGMTDDLGNLETYGFELEATYMTENTRVVFSHAVTKMIDWDPKVVGADAISAEPLGYGNDLGNWSTQQSKLYVRQKITDELSADGNVRVYWGYDGMQDFAHYVEDYYASILLPPLPEVKDSHYRPSVFLSLGLEYEFSKKFKARLDGHDLLGFLNEDYNRRFYGFYLEGDSRSAAPAVSLTLSYKF